jgi:hypothetical protein
MDLGGLNWSIITIVGPLILVVVLVWAVFRNKSEKADPERTERATHDVYDEEEKARREEDGDA